MKYRNSLSTLFGRSKVSISVKVVYFCIGIISHKISVDAVAAFIFFFLNIERPIISKMGELLSYILLDYIVLKNYNDFRTFS